jgi:hypothetical protein
MIRHASNPGVHLGDGEASKCTVYLRLVACHKLTGRRAKGQSSAYWVFDTLRG